VYRVRHSKKHRVQSSAGSLSVIKIIKSKFLPFPNPVFALVTMDVLAVKKKLIEAL
jgi:hypothetical protein